MSKSKKTTLVIVQFRDPYYWVDAMRRKPHHATEHIHLDWKTFVTKPWTMERVGFDLELEGVNATNANSKDLRPNVTCKDKFKYHQVNSCLRRPFPDGYFEKRMWSQHQPYYEMHYDTGEPYSSLLELRRDKILNLLDTAHYSYVKDHMVVQYENLVSDGTESVIRRIEEATGATAHCEPYPPQKKRAPKELNQKFVKWISDHIDWDTEALIGYKKW